MIPHPYTFAVLAVTRQFPEVLRHPLGGGVFSSWSHTRGTAAVLRGLRFCRSITPTTCSGGCLGSSSGEGRSELRYAQRCAEFRELQSVERIAPSGSPLGTSGSVSCSFYPPRTSVRRDAARATSVNSRWHVGSARVCTRVAHKRERPASVGALCRTLVGLSFARFISHPSWTRPQTGLPAEFKHISERRN